MAVAQGFQRITDFHVITRRSSREGRTHRRIMRRRSYASNQARDQGLASHVTAPALFQTNSGDRLSRGVRAKDRTFDGGSS